MNYIKLILIVICFGLPKVCNSKILNCGILENILTLFTIRGCEVFKIKCSN